MTIPSDFPHNDFPAVNSWASQRTRRFSAAAGDIARPCLHPHRPRLGARPGAARRDGARTSRAIAVAFRSGGVPGWMRLKGEAYALGERRYSLLVEILNAPPASAADLAMQRLAADDSEMRDGPRDWACGRLALAERRLLAAA